MLRVAPYGESDAVVTLLTERDGVVAAIAKRARAGSSKRGWILEPFHTLAVEIAPGAGELAHLRASSIAVARASLLEDSAALETAGIATRWVRLLCPPRAAEPEVFLALGELLDALVDALVDGARNANERATSPSTDGTLAAFGLRLLDALGYGLELLACARCARPRPKGRAAFVTAQSGGVLCEACRLGSATDEPPLPGDLLDAVGSDPSNAASAAPEAAAELLRVVRLAVDLRARAVGAKAGAR